MKPFLEGRAREKADRARLWATEHASLVSALLIALGAFRILATLTIFSATVDEPVHVTAGLQLAETGRYGWQLENPPPARLVFGTLLRLGGTHFDASRESTQMMRDVFYETGHYKTSLFLARAGNTLFFLIAAIATWWLARRMLGPAGAALATLLFTTQPVILGYSGIANHDMACVAGFAIALAAFQRWIDRPTALRAILAGTGFGVAVGFKFSNLLFVPAACAAVYAVHLVADRSVRLAWRNALLALPLAAAGAFAGLWACYGFAFGSMQEYGIVKPGPEESVIARLIAPVDPRTPMPMPHFVAGLSGIATIDRGGFLSYAFGMRTDRGWWWYFPVAVAFKSTLAILLLCIAGFVLARGKPFAASMAAAVSVLAVAAPSTLDLGVRYVLPLYVPLSIGAGAAVLACLRHQRRGIRIAAIALLCWHCIASLAAHPDYFPYFNELGGREPGRILVDSNLDWGQDMLRLRDVLREVEAKQVALSVTGWHDYAKLGYPPTTEGLPWLPTKGWIAVSEHLYRMMEADAGFWWLRDRHYRRVGKSLRLYYMP